MAFFPTGVPTGVGYLPRDRLVGYPVVRDRVYGRRSDHLHRGDSSGLGMLPDRLHRGKRNIRLLAGTPQQITRN